MKTKKYDDRIQFKINKSEKEVFDKAVAELFKMDMSDYFRGIVSGVIAQYNKQRV